jgi:hypothetical protein
MVMYKVSDRCAHFTGATFIAAILVESCKSKEGERGESVSERGRIVFV